MEGGDQSEDQGGQFGNSEQNILSCDLICTMMISGHDGGA